MSKISNIVAMSGADPGPRILNANSGDWASAANVGVGVYTMSLAAARGLLPADGNIFIPGIRGILAGGDLQSVQYDADADATGIAKVLQTREETVALSAVADFDVDYLYTSLLNTENRNARIIGLAKIGAVAGAGAVPGYVFATGAFDTSTLVNTGPGIYQVVLTPGYGGDATEVIMIAQPNLIPTPRMLSCAVSHTTDIAKQISIVQEIAGGAAVGPSILLNTDVNIALIGIGASPELEVGRIAAQTRFNEAGGASTFIGASAAWDQPNFVATGAGDYDLPYNAGYGQDAGETLYFFGYPNAAPAALVAASYDDSVDGQVTIVTREEQALGAESVDTDMLLDILVLTASPQ